VKNGHQWSSIKQYTLSEIGSFFKIITIAERAQEAQFISNIWQGNNLTYDGLKSVLNNLGINSKSTKTEEMLQK